VLLTNPNGPQLSSPGKPPDANQDDPDLAEAKGITFGLERDLQQALRGNMGQLEPGLTIADNGRERTTDAGRIDITATDDSGGPVIVELKAGTARPDAITQLLAYMAALAESGEKGVRGILVAGEFHRNIVLAARAVPDLSLKRYTFEFRFKRVE
jgi:RecB family endonuclease NucS